jgi:hypothetical protein
MNGNAGNGSVETPSTNTTILFAASSGRIPASFSISNATGANELEQMMYFGLLSFH